MANENGAAGAAGAGNADAGAAAAAAADAAAANAAGGAGPAEWLKPFGEHAKPFEAFKEPAALAKAWADRETELTTLKSRDWRKELAGDDENIAKAVGRYTDPKALGKALVEAQTKIRSGELAKPLAADAKPEEIAAWRAANGIPEKAEDYFAKLPGGLVIGKDDQPIMNDLAALAHADNIRPDFVHKLAKWYYDKQSKDATDERALDEADRQKSIGELRTIMGADYSTNMAILENFLPEGLRDQIKGAVLKDGTSLWHHTPTMEFLMGAARKMNPAAHLLPSGNANSGFASLEAEMSSLKKLMSDRSSAYWKGPDAEKNQKRYRDLVEASLHFKKAG